MPEWLLIAAVAWNAVVFLLYALDKWAAVKRRRRLRERTLLCCAFFGGSAGALLGMVVCRHKIRKWRFVLGVPVCLVLHAALGYIYI